MVTLVDVVLDVPPDFFNFLALRIWTRDVGSSRYMMPILCKPLVVTGSDTSKLQIKKEKTIP